MPHPSPLLNLPATRTERWELLSRCIADWYRPLAPGDGYSGAELREGESHLGKPLPVAFCEWYGIAGRRDDIWRQQDRLLSLEKLFIEDGVLHFCVENQGVTSWGIRIENLSEEDPPVVVRDEEENWVVQSSQLSEFVIHLAAFVVQFRQGGAQIHGYAHPECLERIVGELLPLGFPEFIWTRSRFFGFRDLIVAIDGTDYVTASGWSGDSLKPFRDLIDAGGFEILYEADGFAKNDG